MNAAVEVVPLGEAVKPIRPRVKPSNYPDLPFIGMEHVEAHTMKLLGTVASKTMKSSAVHFKPGDVLYGRLRPYLNKVYRPAFEGLCSAEFIVLSETERVDGAYLQYFLNSSAFVRFASSLNAGDRPRVDFSQLTPFPLPLPSTNEQRRIVAELEKLFSRLDDAVATLRRVQAALKHYWAAVLEAAIDGRLVHTEAACVRTKGRSYETGEQLIQGLLDQHQSESRGRGRRKPMATPDTNSLPDLPEGWIWATIDQLAASEPNAFTDGPFGSNLKTQHYQNEGPRVIRLQNIKDGWFSDERAHISQSHFEQLKKHQIFAGDIAIASLCDNPPRSCIIPSHVGPAIVKADCIRFKPHSCLSAAYINAALNSPPTRRRTRDILHGIGRPRLSLAEIRSIVIPVPPLAEQMRISEELYRASAFIGQLKTAVGKALLHSEGLRQSVSNKAFHVA